MELYNGLQLVRVIGERLSETRLQRVHIPDVKVNSNDVMLLFEQFLATTNFSCDGITPNSRGASFICASSKISLDVNYSEYVETKCYEIQQFLKNTQVGTFFNVNCAEEFLDGRQIINHSLKGNSIHTVKSDLLLVIVEGWS